MPRLAQSTGMCSRAASNRTKGMRCDQTHHKICIITLTKYLFSSSKIQLHDSPSSVYPSCRRHFFTAYCPVCIENPRDFHKNGFGIKLTARNISSFVMHDTNPNPIQVTTISCRTRDS